MQSEVFKYFLNRGDAQLLVCEDDKDAVAALSAAEFAGLKVFRLPDFKAPSVAIATTPRLTVTGENCGFLS